MDFYDMLKAKAIGNSGGDTPSPSGDPHFSQFIYIDWWNHSNLYMNSADGAYALPNVEEVFVRSDGYGSIILLSPVKTITNQANIMEHNNDVQFTPDADFHLDFEITGEITAGDGKNYLLFYEDGEFQVMTDGVDFYTSIS